MIDQHATLAEKFLKKWFWLYLFSFIIAPIWYIIKIIISGELTVSEVWILYGIISLITLLYSYNDLWMTESLKHFIPKFVTEKRYDKVKSILSYALLAQIISSLIIASFFFFWADFIANNYFKTEAAKEVLKVFAFFFIGINIFQTINTFFLAIQNTFYNKLTELIRMVFILWSVLFIYFWDHSSLVNYSYSWLIWLYAWILGILFIFYIKYYKKELEGEKIIWSKKLFKTVFNYALLVFLWTSIWTILGQIDMQMVIYMLGTTDAGYYTNYLSVIGIPFLVITPIFALLFPVFSEMHSKWETEKIKLVKQIFTNIFIIIWIFSVIFFFVFSLNIATVLFWEKFITSWIILQYSVLFLVFNFLLQINFNIIAGIWQVHKRVKIVLIAVIFNFFTNILFINIYWVWGAALATWLGWILIYWLSEYFLWKNYRINFDYINILKNIFAIWIIWLFSYYYIIPKLIIWDWNRIDNLLSLFIIFIIWWILFLIINKKDVKMFIWEIKALKNKI